MFITATVRGLSMSPTLKDGDALLLDTSVKPTVGDIVALKIQRKFRHNNEPYVIKRIVAADGDTVYSHNGDLYVNSKKISCKSYGETRDIRKATVPKGYVYVLGDNRENSLDSRSFGCVPYKSIVGKMIRKLKSSQLRSTAKGYKPKSILAAFKIVKSEIYRKWGLEE